MRGAPHVGFSAFMRRINWRICAFTCGRPGRRRSRPPPPKPPESGTMPGNHGLRLNDDQGFGPALPQPAEDIEAIQFGPGLLPLEDGELLAKSDGFQGEFATWQKKVEWHSSTRLIFIRDGILM